MRRILKSKIHVFVSLPVLGGAFSWCEHRVECVRHKRTTYTGRHVSGHSNNIILLDLVVDISSTQRHLLFGVDGRTDYQA